MAYGSFDDRLDRRLGVSSNRKVAKSLVRAPNPNSGA